MAKNIIEEYLVSLGWEIDETSSKKAGKLLDSFAQGVEKISDALAGNKAFTALKKNLNGFINVASTRIADFLATTAGAVTVISGGIIAGITAIGVAFTALTHKYLTDMAKMDLATQLFARRLYTTVDNARSLQSTMKALGLSDLDQLNDVAFNPELRKQFLELRALTKQLDLNSEQKQGFKNIRAFNLELQKTGLILNYFWQALAGSLGSKLQGLLSFGSDFIKNINTALSGNFQKIIDTVSKLFDVGLKFITLFLPVADGSGLSGLNKALGVTLDIINAILDGVLSLLDGLQRVRRSTYSGLKNFGLERLSTTLDGIKSLIEKIFDWARRIWEKPGEVAREAFKGVIRIVSNAVANSGPSGAIIHGAGSALKASGTLDYLKQAAKDLGLTITSTTGGKHNPGSRHYTGEAIDIDHRNVTADKLAALRARGISVFDERQKTNPAWSGAHYHLQFTAAQYAKRMAEAAKISSRTEQPSEVKKTVEGSVIKQDVSIQINGAGDPDKVAMAVAKFIQDQASLGTRSMQGSFA